MSKRWTIQYADPELDGGAAHQAGYPRDSSPYEAHSQNDRLWREAWSQSFRTDQKLDKMYLKSQYTRPKSA